MCFPIQVQTRVITSLWVEIMDTFAPVTIDWLPTVCCDDHLRAQHQNNAQWSRVIIKHADISQLQLHKL